jgi:protein phosphatase
MTQTHLHAKDSVQIRIFAQTDVGMVRQGNEDNFLAVDLSTASTWTADHQSPPPELLSFAQGQYGALFAVSDGMGGALAGEVASQMAVNVVRDGMLRFQTNAELQKFPFHERLRLSVEQANIVINDRSQTNAEYAGMGATFTAAGVERTTLYLAQIGDSRAYLIRRGRIAQLTKDQSLVSQLVDSGHITLEEAETHPYRNVILQALGATPNVVVVVDRVPLCQGDVLLLCSDGLSGKMNAAEMLEIFLSYEEDLSSACNEMIRVANERGGEDNITVMLLHFDGDAFSPPEENGGVTVTGIQRDARLPDELDRGLLSGDEPTLSDETIPTDELPSRPISKRHLRTARSRQMVRPARTREVRLSAPAGRAARYFSWFSRLFAGGVATAALLCRG